MKNTLVISAYTCCGKTYTSEHIKDYDILDVDIRKFKTIKRLPNEEEIEEERKWWEPSLHLMSVEGHLNQFKQHPNVIKRILQKPYLLVNRVKI